MPSAVRQGPAGSHHPGMPGDCNASGLCATGGAAGYQKIWSPDPKLGFLAGADQLATQLAGGLVAAEKVGQVRSQIFNLRLDAAVTDIFMALVALIVVDAVRVWARQMRSAPVGQMLPRVEG